MVIKSKGMRGLLMSSLQKGLQGILYDSEHNYLLACDAGSGQIITLDPTTGILFLVFLFYFKSSLLNDYLILYFKGKRISFVTYPVLSKSRNLCVGNIWLLPVIRSILASL